MGTPNFFNAKKHPFTASGTNLQARAIGASSYSSRSAGSGASKDIAAAKAAVQHGMKATTKTSASNAPGPKKV